MAEQMGALIMAQRGYQANAQVVDRARETYQAALADWTLLMPVSPIAPVQGVMPAPTTCPAPERPPSRH